MANSVRAVGGSLGGSLPDSTAASALVDGASPVVAGHACIAMNFAIPIDHAEDMHALAGMVHLNVSVLHNRQHPQ